MTSNTTNNQIDKVVVMARGLGTRMRKHDDSARLKPEQAAIAETGMKALIPIDRPFLDYVLHVVAQAGYKRICLIIGPEHDEIRDYYTNKIKCNKLQIEFAIQEKPLGTADAVLPAEKFTDGDDFLVINSDTYYPLEAFTALRKLNGPGLALFERNNMIATSNIPAERITKFAVVETDEQGNMIRIIEKPDEATIAALPEPIGISMNCWRFNSTIFEACRSISPSPRGELELPDAVMYTINKLNQKYAAPVVKGTILDMSGRADIASVTEKLAGSRVEL